MLNSRRWWPECGYAAPATLFSERSCPENRNTSGHSRYVPGTNCAQRGVSLSPAISSRRDLEAAAFDYQAIDTLFPHPVYGRMRWVSVITPESTWAQCRGLLEAARQLRERRPDSW
ncbi:DUF6194 family protein [Devosia insulae]|uniref:DUF6194 family protein n=1 Tax=Devosia insulae TaxID=408174 RepID=UPI00114CB332|nr:DUF6194 family protein [Devosia insulae]